MRKIPIENFCIPSDYRKETTDVGSLALSIQEVGLLYPILVEQQDDKFVITEGRRRFRALTEVLGYTELEEYEHFMERKNLKVANDLVIQFIGNNEREDFKPLEAASLVRDIHASTFLFMV
jgi:ParB-like chromosome segregation protein Spo0J